jgi:hypothetical protein
MMGGSPLLTGALVALGILLVGWLIAIVAEGDVDDGTERLFGVVSGILLGLASIAVIIVGELGSIVAEAPGYVATALVGTLGWLSLSGLVDVGAQLFAFLVIATVIGTIATREA